jgi:hypothetical protein
MEVKMLSEKRKAQMRAYSHARYHRNKRLKGTSRRGIECTEYYKAWRIAAGKCMDCGFVITPDNYYLIDADHRVGVVKRFNLSKAHKYGLQSTIEELAKCDPVCCRCHRIRTYQRSHEFGQKGWATRRNDKTQLQIQVQ